MTTISANITVEHIGMLWSIVVLSLLHFYPVCAGVLVSNVVLSLLHFYPVCARVPVSKVPSLEHVRDY